MRFQPNAAHVTSPDGDLPGDNFGVIVLESGISYPLKEQLPAQGNAFLRTMAQAPLRTDLGT